MEKSGSKSIEFMNKAKAEITRELFKVAVYTSEMVRCFLFEKASKSNEMKDIRRSIVYCFS